MKVDSPFQHHLLCDIGNFQMSAADVVQFAGLLTICPETITETLCFQFPRCKMKLGRQKLILPEALLARKYGMEILQIPYENYSAKNNSNMVSAM